VRRHNEMPERSEDEQVDELRAAYASGIPALDAMDRTRELLGERCDPEARARLEAAYVDIEDVLGGVLLKCEELKGAIHLIGAQRGRGAFAGSTRKDRLLRLRFERGPVVDLGRMMFSPRLVGELQRALLDSTSASPDVAGRAQRIARTAEPGRTNSATSGRRSRRTAS
jgi:hypothetical protein